MNKLLRRFGLTTFICSLTIISYILISDFSTFRMKVPRPLSQRQHHFVKTASRETDLTRLAAIQMSVSHTTQASSRDISIPASVQMPLTVTNRPLTCHRCFSSNFSTLIENPDICSQTTKTKPEMIIMITTSPHAYEYRQTIRDTWISVTEGNTAHIRHVFLLGTTNDTFRKDIITESLKYKDILLTDFVDSYGNLTYKTLAGMRWIVQHCAQAKFFMKTDQDMYVVPEKILELARTQEDRLKTAIGGHCEKFAKPWRKPKSKYFASVRSYPQSTYPGFCSGTGYISTMDVARKILETSPDIPFFHLEDVYLSLVLDNVHYKLIRYRGFKEWTQACVRRSKHRPVFTIHELSPEKIRALWAKKCGF